MDWVLGKLDRATTPHLAPVLYSSYMQLEGSSNRVHAVYHK